jgi:hypothetical protein
LIYSPTFAEDDYREDYDWQEYAKMMGRVATRELPVVLSFVFFDEEPPAPASGRTSPLRDNHSDIEDEPQRPPSPVRVEEKPPKPKKEEEDPDEDLMPVMTSSRLQPDASQFPIVRSKLKGQLSRAERARLLNVGFPTILDDYGAKPIQIHVGAPAHPVSMSTPGKQKDDLTSVLGKIDFDVEANDRLKDNEITLTLMGLTFSGDMRNHLTGM